MSLIDKLQAFLTSPAIPDEVREQARRAEGLPGLKKALDHLCLINEVKQRELEKEIQTLDQLERAEVETLKNPPDGEPHSERGKKLILQRILRIRRRIQALDDRIDIHDKNIQVQLNLLSQIQRIESMSMQGVDDSLITEIHGDAEEAFDRYMSVARLADAAHDADATPLTVKDRQDLRDLERELMGAEAPPKEREEKASSVNEPEVVPETADLAQAEAEADAAVADVEAPEDATPAPSHREMADELDRSEALSEELKALEEELLGKNAEPASPQAEDNRPEPEAELE